MKNLNILEEIDCEIVHYFDNESGDCISSIGNRFKIKINQKIIRFQIPHFIFFTQLRLIRRLSRLDKSNAVFNWAKDGIIVIYQKKIYFFDLASQQLKLTEKLTQSRNALHGGIAVTKNGVFFGEYGNNKKRNPVPIWGSYDDGRSFKIVHKLIKSKIRHVHGIYKDTFSDSLWICTGDSDGECFLIEVHSADFANITWHGDGTQKWRAVSLLFTKNAIVWGMDCPNMTPCLQTFDRKKGIIKSGQKFNAPVWYMKSFKNGDAVLQTSVEIGEAVKSKYATIFYSRDLISWVPIRRFKKDFWPMSIFKFGVISFADGPQTHKSFMISGEALKGFDGQSLKVAIG